MHARCETFRCIDVRELPRLKALQPTVFHWSSDGSVFDVIMVVDNHVLRTFEPGLIGGEKKWATQVSPSAGPNAILVVSGRGLTARLKIVTGGLQSFTGRTVASSAGAALAWPTRASSKIPGCEPHAAPKRSDRAWAGPQESRFG
jgi:hypothetical protein